MLNTKSRNYHNFLKDRENENTFLWVSRKLDLKRSFKQTEPRPNPQLHKNEVLQSKKIQELLTKISKEQNIPKEKLERKVTLILNEIGYNRSMKLIRWLGLVLTKICLQISTGIYINLEGIKQVREQMGSCPVIFVPSHRSYADFILMSEILFGFDIEIPAIAAGMDFHGMWGMGTMLRDTGAFFMRRSYNNDQLYWTTFKQYVYQLVTRGDLPIEFFIEGTRSRSNKSLQPKYGLISMILKAFFLNQVPDVLFVPINISYDRILEESLFAYELLGIPKPKESTSGFFKSMKIVKENFGRIYFHFSEVISTKAFLGKQVDKTVHNLVPIHQQEITDYERSLIPPLAFQIVKKQQENCVVFAFNLIAMLMNSLSSKQPSMKVIELKSKVLWLNDSLKAFGAFTSVQTEDDIVEALEVHKNVIGTMGTEVILVVNNIVLDKYNPSRLKAHCLSEKTLTYSVPFIMLQLYINPVLHLVIDPVLIVVILKQAKLSKKELFDHFLFLRGLFEVEFVSLKAWREGEFEEGLQKALKTNLIEEKDNFYVLGENCQLIEILYRSIEAFFLSYWTTLQVLKDIEVCDEKNILVEVQKVLEQALGESQEFLHPYALNLDTLVNCLSSLVSLDAIAKNRREGKVFYNIKKGSVEDILGKLEQFVNICHVNGKVGKAPFLQNKL